MVILYQVKLPFSHYENSVVEKVIVDEEPESYVLIESKSCSCGTRDGIAVKNKEIFTSSDDKLIASSIYYSIAYKTKEEFETAVLWLVKSNFCSVVFSLKRVLSGGTLKRVAETSSRNNSAFKKPVRLSCGCKSHERRGAPIYCTDKKVVFNDVAGLTIKEVIKSKLG
jgi:hypothetical protein